MKKHVTKRMLGLVIATIVLLVNSSFVVSAETSSALLENNFENGESLFSSATIVDFSDAHGKVMKISNATDSTKAFEKWGFTGGASNVVMSFDFYNDSADNGYRVILNDTEGKYVAFFAVNGNTFEMTKGAAWAGLGATGLATAECSVDEWHSIDIKIQDNQKVGYYLDGELLIEATQEAGSNGKLGKFIVYVSPLSNKDGALYIDNLYVTDNSSDSFGAKITNSSFENDGSLTINVEETITTELSASDITVTNTEDGEDLLIGTPVVSGHTISIPYTGAIVPYTEYKLVFNKEINGATGRTLSKENMYFYAQASEENSIYNALDDDFEKGYSSSVVSVSDGNYISIEDISLNGYGKALKIYNSTTTDTKDCAKLVDTIASSIAASKTILSFDMKYDGTTAVAENNTGVIIKLNDKLTMISYTGYYGGVNDGGYNDGSAINGTPSAYVFTSLNRVDDNNFHNYKYIIADGKADVYIDDTYIGKLTNASLTKFTSLSFNLDAGETVYVDNLRVDVEMNLKSNLYEDFSDGEHNVAGDEDYVKVIEETNGNKALEISVGEIEKTTQVAWIPIDISSDSNAVAIIDYKIKLIPDEAGYVFLNSQSNENSTSNAVIGNNGYFGGPVNGGYYGNEPSGTSSEWVYSSANTVNDGLWHSVKMYVDNANNLVKYYIDGKFVGTNGKTTTMSGNKGLTSIQISLKNSNSKILFDDISSYVEAKYVTSANNKVLKTRIIEGANTFAPTDSDVSLTAEMIKLYFANPMTGTTLTDETIKLYVGGSEVDVNIGEYNSDEYSITVMPTKLLRKNSVYTIMVTGAYNAEGEETAEYIATFKTTAEGKLVIKEMQFIDENGQEISTLVANQKVFLKAIIENTDDTQPVTLILSSYNDDALSGINFKKLTINEGERVTIDNTSGESAVSLTVEDLTELKLGGYAWNNFTEVKPLTPAIEY